MRKLLKYSTILFLLLLPALSWIHCEDPDEDDTEECEPAPLNCRMTKHTEGELYIALTINDENPTAEVSIYRGDYSESKTPIETIVTAKTSISRTLALDYYSAAVTYTYGKDNIIAIDGDSITSTSSEYCDGITCWELHDANLDIRFDEDAYKKYKEGSSDKCFIATAVYGSINADEVKELRSFRDRVLMPYSAGRFLVRYYYRYSPGWVTVLEENPGLSRFIKFWLDIFVFFLRYPNLFYLTILSSISCILLSGMRRKFCEFSHK